MSIWKTLLGSPRVTNSKRQSRRPNRRRLQLESLEDRRVFSAAPFDGAMSELAAEAPAEPPAYVASLETTAARDNATRSDSDGPSPVLLVISNQDFWYQDYADTREALEAQGLDVVVAATSTDVARPHADSGQDVGVVQPDLALTDVEVEDYSAIVFTGGWGMAQYQYGFEGTYHDSPGQEDKTVKLLVNQFFEEDKHVAAVCYGVSVLAYARVDGAAPADGEPLISDSQTESSSAFMAVSRAGRDPTTASDDVIVDGNIITAENYDSARIFSQRIADLLLGR